MECSRGLEEGDGAVELELMGPVSPLGLERGGAGSRAASAKAGSEGRGCGSPAEVAVGRRSL